MKQMFIGLVALCSVSAFAQNIYIDGGYGFETAESYVREQGYIEVFNRETADLVISKKEIVSPNKKRFFINGYVLTQLITLSDNQGLELGSEVLLKCWAQNDSQCGGFQGGDERRKWTKKTIRKLLRKYNNK